jgi:hypothetical protein
MATFFARVAASLQPLKFVRERARRTDSTAPDAGSCLTVRDPADADPDRLLAPVGVFLLPGTGFFFASVSIAAALLLCASCALQAPSPVDVTSPVVQQSASVASAEASCELRDLEMLQAAWAYVRESYPTQPWPNRVYLVGERSAAAPLREQSLHVVLCSHATGFVWEGDVVWRSECACCRAQVEGVRELFVTTTTAVTVPGEDQ